MEILARYLERTDRPVYAAVRGRDRAEAEARLRTAVQCMFGSARRVRRPAPCRARRHRAPRGSGSPTAERDELAERVTDIVHSAASVSFTLPLDRSREINVEGTRRMLEFARAVPRPRRPARATRTSPRPTWPARIAASSREEQLDVGQDFRNPYEQSKFEAERLVRAHAGRLPIQVFRPSIVVGERTTGWTASFNVLYTPLKAFVRGVAAGAARAPLRARRRGARSTTSRTPCSSSPTTRCEGAGTYHLVAGAQATSVGRLIELSAQHVGQREPRVIPPGLFKRVVYPVLAGTSRRRRRGLQRTRVFFPYFAMDVSYGNANARRRPRAGRHRGARRSSPTSAAWSTMPTMRTGAARRSRARKRRYETSATSAS